MFNHWISLATSNITGSDLDWVTICPPEMGTEMFYGEFFEKIVAEIKPEISYKKTDFVVEIWTSLTAIYMKIILKSTWEKFWKSLLS